MPKILTVEQKAEQKKIRLAYAKKYYLENRDRLIKYAREKCKYAGKRIYLEDDDPTTGKDFKKISKTDPDTSRSETQKAIVELPPKKPRKAPLPPKPVKKEKPKPKKKFIIKEEKKEPKIVKTKKKIILKPADDEPKKDEEEMKYDNEGNKVPSKEEEPKPIVNKKELTTAIKQYLKDQIDLSKDKPVPFLPAKALDELYMLFLLENNDNDCYISPFFTIDTNGDKFPQWGGKLMTPRGGVDRITRQYIECKKKGKIMVILMSINVPNVGGHANMIIFNTKRNEIERFEPHGQYADIPDIDPDELNRQIREFILKPMNKKLKKEGIEKLKFVPSNKVCPKGYAGFQAYESNAINKEKQSKKLQITIKDTEGYCLAWSLFYADLRLKFPNIEANKLIKISIDEITKDPEKLRSFIRGITKFYYNNMKRILNIPELKNVYNDDGRINGDVVEKVVKYIKNQAQKYSKD